jgi:hypothetical protein
MNLEKDPYDTKKMVNIIMVWDPMKKNTNGIEKVMELILDTSMNIAIQQGNFTILMNGIFTKV